MERAKDGDATAQRYFVGLLLPRRKGAPIHLTLPEIRTAADLAAALQAVLDAVAAGDITPAEGVDAVSVIKPVGEAQREANFFHWDGTPHWTPPRDA